MYLHLLTFLFLQCPSVFSFLLAGGLSWTYLEGKASDHKFPLLLFIWECLGFSLTFKNIFLYTCLFQLKYVCVWMLTQSCLTLCDPLNCSPPGSSVHRIFQVGIPEWVAVSFSRSSRPSDEPASCGSCVGRWGLHHWGHLVDLQCYSNVIQLRVYIVSFIFFSIMVY